MLKKPVTQNSEKLKQKSVRFCCFSNNQEQLDQVAADLKAVKSALNNRELQSQFETVYVPFMFALAFAEVWVNSKSFELFF